LPPTQFGPTAVQGVGLHTQAPDVTSQVEWALQAVGVPIGQPLPSAAQATEVFPEQKVFVWPIWQPAGSGLQLHPATPPVGVVHAWCGPQLTGASA
jgi:hypothetical protein